MPDIAELGIAINSTSAVAAAANLEQLIAVAEKASTSVDSLARSSTSLASSQAQTAAAVTSTSASVSTAADRLLGNLEKQIVLFNANEAAIANYNGAMAQMTEAELNHYAAQTRVISQLQAEAAQLQQFYAAQDAGVAAGERFIASLTMQAATIGLNKTELLAYKAAQLGVADAAAPLIATIEAQTSALEQQAKAAADAAAATTALGETEDAATARISAMVEASIAQTADLTDNTIAMQRYAASVDEMAASAGNGEKAQVGMAAGARAAGEAQAAAAVSAKAAADANDMHNAATVRTTAALERELFAVTASRAELVEYDAQIAGATESQVAFQVALVKSIAAAQAQVAANTAAAASAMQLKASTSGVTTEILVLGRELARGDVSRFGGSLTRLASLAGATSLLFNPFTIALAATGIAAVKADENLSKYGEDVTRVSEQTGASADFVQKFNFAVASMGGKATDGGAALDHLTQQIGVAEAGGKRAQATFAAVGLSMNDLKTMSPEQVMDQIAVAFSNTADNAAKYVDAQVLLGSSSHDLIQLLDQGAAGLDAFGAKAQNVGAVLSDSTIKAMVQLHMSNSQAKADWDALVTSAESQLVPALLAITQAMHDSGAEATAISYFFQGVGGVLKTVAAVVATVGTAFVQLGDTINATATAANLAGQGKFKEASDAIVQGFHNVQSEGVKYQAFMDKLYTPLDQLKTPDTPHPTKSLAIAPRGGNGGAGSVDTDAMKGQVQATQDQLKNDEAAITTQMDVIKDAYKSGQMTASQYYSQQRELLAQGATDQIVAANKEIAALQLGLDTYKLTANQRAVITNEIKQDQAVAGAAVEKFMNGISKSAADQKAAVDKAADAMKAYKDVLNGQIATQQNTADMKVASMGMGSREAGLASENNAAQQAYDAKADQLKKADDQAGNTPESTQKYTQELADQKAYENQVIALNNDTYNRITQAQTDWESGAKKAWTDWSDNANNLSGQVGNVTTTMLNGLTNSLLTFATTGKLNFTALADSIIKDLARIAIQSAESKIFSLIPGLGGAGAGLGGAAGAVDGVGDSLITAATGGYIDGKGSGASDSVNAKVSNGEFVVNAHATAAHRATLEALNGKGASDSGKRHFATGGYAGPSTPANPNMANMTNGVSGSTITFNIGGGGSSPAGQGQGSPNAAATNVKNAAMQKELEASVIEIVRKHSLAGGQINKIINTAVTT